MKYLFSSLFIILVLMIFKPLPSPTIKNCVSVKGIIEDIRAGKGENDIVFQLKGDLNSYYINRGLENDLTITKLENNLLQQSITLHYIKHWTPLDPTNSNRHIAKVTHREKVIYDEIK